MILLFDTETTGLVEHKLPAEHPSQPHLVQYAGILTNDAGRVFGALSAISEPSVDIPEKASSVHGITDALAERFGKSLDDILDWHNSAWHSADLIVCHNYGFDSKVMEAAMYRSGMEAPPSREIYCTMEESTGLLKLPGKYGYKWPKLEELHRFLFEEMFSGAHDALGDVRATLRCYLELMRREQAEGTET